MTDIKHTPAPWKKSDDFRCDYLIIGSNGYAVADCKVYHGKSDIVADSNLITASPIMLKALQDIAKELEDNIEVPQYIYDAINQAEGKI